MSDRPKNLQIIFPTTTTSSSITRTTTREYFLAFSDCLFDHVSIKRAKKLHLKSEKSNALLAYFKIEKPLHFIHWKNNFHAIQTVIA